MTATIRKDFLIDRQGKTFALYAGLLDAAHSEDIGLTGIVTDLVLIGSEQNGQTWMFKAVVTTKKGTFTGYGDATPSNVGRQMLNCLPRMAETRAKARALRDAVNAGAVVALEELEDSATDDEDRPMGEPTFPRGVLPMPTPSAKTAQMPPSQRELDAIQERELAEMGQQAPKVADGNGVTSAQLRAIYAIARGSKGLNEAQIEAMCKSQYRVKPSELTKKQGSDFITALQGQGQETAKA